MHGDNPISWLMFFTLVAGVVVIAGGFIYDLRSRSHREIAANALQGDGSGKGAAPSGAGPELIGFALLALAVMGLLAAGYHHKPQSETAQMTTPVGVANSGNNGSNSGGKTTGMAQPVGTANQPKPFQPSNPAPDKRIAPTSSDTGAGAANGSTGQPQH